RDTVSRLNAGGRVEHSRQTNRKRRDDSRPVDQLHARDGAALLTALYRYRAGDRSRGSYSQSRAEKCGQEPVRCVSLEQWNERYRVGEQLFETPSPLVQRFAGLLRSGVALDLACGPGRNALYLAQQGWRVTAVDGSSVAIETLLDRAARGELQID